MTETFTESKSNIAWSFVRPLVPKAIIAAVIAAAAVGVLAVIVGHFDTIHIQMIFTIIVMITFVFLSWYDADVSSKRSSTFALISVILSGYLLVAGFAKIWIHTGGFYSLSSEVWIGFAEWIWLVLIARAALLHAHLLLTIHAKYRTHILQTVAKITMVLIAVVAVMLSLPTLFSDSNFNFGEGYWRLFAIVVILDVLGTILIPLSNALFNRQEKPSVPIPPTPQVFYREEEIEHVVRQIPAPEPLRNSTPGTIVFENPPVPSNILAWPRYVDGRALPALPDGTPDFSQVERY